MMPDNCLMDTILRSVSRPFLAAFQKRAYVQAMTSVCLGFRKLLATIVACSALYAGTAAGAPDDASIEFPVETAALVAATTAFFDAIEGTPRPASRVPVIQMPSLAQKTSAQSVTEASALTRNGPVSHLTGYRVSWYPVDRFLGSVDFMGTWNGNRNLVCGYLTWDLTQPESPVLDGISANFLSIDEFEGRSPAEVHERLLEANCAYGAIDENYAFFEPAG